MHRWDARRTRRPATARAPDNNPLPGAAGRAQCASTVAVTAVARRCVRARPCTLGRCPQSRPDTSDNVPPCWARAEGRPD
eukprot:5605779-Prymnesium_polylepis.1